MCREPSHIAGRKMSCGLWKETVAVAEDYMQLCCSSPHPAPPSPSEPAAAMRRLAQDLETQHQARFHSLAQTFLKHSGMDLCSRLRKTAAGAEGQEPRAGTREAAGTAAGACKLPSAGRDHCGLPGEAQKRLATGK
ncbi:hypothetical protein GOODEAATRI_007417 [Goodea atripinnis]|uniref:Uncharacterized protein n=1 Tax=Goodea atripinnis TaxID=208336 RepID=A0ABV0PLL6_9TELE